MRSLLRRAVIVGTCLSAAVVWSGCEAKQTTEYVTGISTQVTVPRDLKAVRVEVTVAGFTQFCRAYKVYDGKVQLPRSLGTFASNENAITQSGPITYSILGISEDFEESSANPLFSVCAQPKVGEQNARILRRSRQPYIKDEVLFLPMPLKYACWDKNCPDDQTCKGGTCVPATLSEEEARSKFPRYSPDLVDGTGGTCFSTTVCMKAAAPVITVDQATCTYAVPNTPSAPGTAFNLPNPFSGPASGEGVNVEITFDGGRVREILDIDPDEGFTTPDPANPQRFKLSAGLCEMVKGVDAGGVPTKHRITGIRASGTCQAKRLAQPICAGDALAAMGVGPDGVTPTPPPAEICAVTELKSPQAALMLVVDDTTNHAAFFDSVKKAYSPADEDSYVGAAINAAFSDPSFQRTDLGLFYSSGPAGTCGTAGPALPVETTPIAKDKILADLKARTLSATNEVQLEGALSRAYTELGNAKYDPYFRRAVLVFSNRFDDGATCAGTPVDVAAAGLAGAKPVQTYVMQLTKSPDKQATADALAAAGGTSGSAYKTAEATVKFQEVVNSLATCVYDADPTDAPKASDRVAYGDPLTGIGTKLSFNAACSGENVAGEGFGAVPGAGAGGKTRVYLCQKSCDDYRTVVKNTSQFAATYNQPTLAVPIFAHRAVCN